MPTQPLRVLISGASVAGPTAAYWLCRQGFAVTVVERMPLARVQTSGRSVDVEMRRLVAGISGRHVEVMRRRAGPHPL
jgi:2-polyprenyl-6-methoxyphenol hydroxylase-like FAD-dependent oxidoreductase